MPNLTTDFIVPQTGIPTNGVWSNTTNCAGGTITNPSPTTITGGDTVDLTGLNPGIYTFSYTVTQGGCIGCTDYAYTVGETVNVDAGVDQYVCSTDCINPTTINLTATLTNSSDGLAGTAAVDWTIGVTPVGSGASISPAVTHNSTIETNIVYTATATNSACVTTDNLTVYVAPFVCAGTATNATICENTNNFNLQATISGSGTAGTFSWSDDDATGVDLTNPINVDFTGVAAGTYDFTYTVTWNSWATGLNLPCTDTETVTITISSTVDAGTATNITICN